jgi:hypothetical protein
MRRSRGGSESSLMSPAPALSVPEILKKKKEDIKKKKEKEN